MDNTEILKWNQGSKSQKHHFFSKASQIALNPNLPDYERKDARLVTGIMGVKSRFGMGIKKTPMKKN